MVISTGLSSVTPRNPTDAPDQRPERPKSGMEDVSAAAFEAFLTIARTASGVASGIRGGQFSPSQVFEPATADAQGQKSGTLREQHRADLRDNPGHDRLDRSSIVARQRLTNGRDGETFRSQAGGSSGLQQARSDAGKLSIDLDGTSVSRHSASEKTELLASRFDSPGVGRDKALGLDDGKKSPALPNGPSAMHADGSSSAGRAGPVVSTAATTNDSQRASPARQVAQVLSGGRAGEVESPRAVSSGSDASGGRDSAGKQASAPGRKSGEASQLLRQNQDAKMDRTGRSPFEQLVRSLRLQAGARHSSARLHLHPPELGRLYVDLRMDGEQLQIDVRTESKAARDLMYERASQLRSALEQQGIHVERFDVTVDQRPEDRTGEYDRTDSETTTPRGWTERQDRASHPDMSVPLEDGEDGDAFVETGVEVDAEVVAETRLDIRI